MVTLVATKTIGEIVFSFETIIFVIAFALVTIGLIRNKQDQSGLSALNGGNQELFLNRKERGLDKILSHLIFGLGISLFVLDLIAVILTNIYL